MLRRTGRFVQIYINGTYSGHYHMRERWNADMQAQYYGGDKDDYEAVKSNGGGLGDWSLAEVYDGDGSAWENIMSLRGDYAAISQYVDLTNFLDFMLIYMAGGSESEYRAAGSSDGSVRYTFYHNDADHWLEGTERSYWESGPRMDPGRSCRRRTSRL